MFCVCEWSVLGVMCVGGAFGERREVKRSEA